MKNLCTEKIGRFNPSNVHSLGKKSRKISAIISVLLVVSMVFGMGSVFAEGTENEAPTYTITAPYEYPIVPDTDEWRAFTSLQEKIDACQIPDEILENMSTEALVETCANYPLMVNIYAFNTLQEGLDSVNSYFNGLQELNKRNDAVVELNNYLQELAVQVRTRSVEDGEQRLKKLYVDALKDTITPMVTQGIQPRATVTTPRGSSVYVEINPELSADQIAVLNTSYDSAYPSATRISTASGRYNCHNYAWNKQSPTGYWMPDASIYKSDGSYYEVGQFSTKVNDIADYGSVHSGIVYSNVASMNIKVRSKWGSAGVYVHYTNDCPYSDAGITFYRLS